MKDEIILNEAIIEEREQGIKEIQQQIGEVNEIFKDLAVLVHEQGTMIGQPYACPLFHFILPHPLVTFCFILTKCLIVHVSDDISSNVESAQASTTQGTSELKRASKIQRSISSNVSLYLFDFFYFWFSVSSTCVMCVCVYISIIEEFVVKQENVI